jgi:hypothetical protein
MNNAFGDRFDFSEREPLVIEVPDYVDSDTRPTDSQRSDAGVPNIARDIDPAVLAEFLGVHTEIDSDHYTGKTVLDGTSQDEPNQPDN